jgi:hypothetical protein
MGLLDTLYKGILSQGQQPQGILSQQQSPAPTGLLGALYANPLIQRQVASQRGAQDEAKFNQWITGLPWYQEFKGHYGEAPNISPSSNYDYRGAWKAGITPVRDPYDQNRYHWPSRTPDGRMLKSADHPTAWKEHFMGKTGVNPDALGLKSEEEAIRWFEGK